MVHTAYITLLGGHQCLSGCHTFSSRFKFMDKRGKHVLSCAEFKCSKAKVELGVRLRTGCEIKLEWSDYYLI